MGREGSQVKTINRNNLKTEIQNAITGTLQSWDAQRAIERELNVTLDGLGERIDEFSVGFNTAEGITPAFLEDMADILIAEAKESDVPFMEGGE